MTDAYQTVAQDAYWGNADRIVDLNTVVTSLPVPSALTVRPRFVLGSDLPRQEVQRVDYRVQIPELLVGDLSDRMAAIPEATFVKVRRDDMRALFMDAAVTGIPEAAQNAGEIIANLTIQPRGRVWRCTAQALGAARLDLASATAQGFVVITAGGRGNVTRGATTVAVAQAQAILDLGSTGGTATVTMTAGMEGWLLSAEPTGVV